MIMDKYILDGKKPIRVSDINVWGKFLEGKERIVAQDEINKDCHISTVFLGLDHSYGDEDPILFETMIFGGIHDMYQERYRTWEESEKRHKQLVKLLKQGEKDLDPA